MKTCCASFVLEFKQPFCLVRNPIPLNIMPKQSKKTNEKKKKEKIVTLLISLVKQKLSKRICTLNLQSQPKSVYMTIYCH